MFSVPLICSSRGDATVSAITLGLAPGNCALTTMVGGTTSGYSEIGSWNRDATPARKMTTEITTAKIGRSMKKRDRFMILAAGRGCGFLRRDHHLRPDMLQAVDDHAVAGLHALQRHALRLDPAAQLDFPVGDLVALAHDE